MHRQQNQLNVVSGCGPVTVSAIQQRDPNVAPGWRRQVNNGEIIYISPSGAVLRNIGQIKEYLLSAGTCKCGLPCPLRPDYFFEFNSQFSRISAHQFCKFSIHDFVLHNTFLLLSSKYLLKMLAQFAQRLACIKPDCWEAVICCKKIPLHRRNVNWIIPGLPPHQYQALIRLGHNRLH
ncbi:Methyl-CpG-binding domain protein 5 [Pseudolycoriella hygida]|uniref:Methyl-CpG-binding domain protein 5 n=1 Tax=Pseudolycoriella hygida TaxID=35572 RepID=A0A9Q0MXT1_9DIPT|nr:Methyl-CpG-binding domain protein 5 [Pseudolycoriella hygida]